MAFKKIRDCNITCHWFYPGWTHKIITLGKKEKVRKQKLSIKAFCLLDFWLCLLDMLSYYLNFTVGFLINFYACNFKRIYAFELHIFYYKNYMVEKRLKSML
jgi:hypothetical protein